jgi:hypothetical protein
LTRGRRRSIIPYNMALKNIVVKGQTPPINFNLALYDKGYTLNPPEKCLIKNGDILSVFDESGITATYAAPEPSELRILAVACANCKLANIPVFEGGCPLVSRK